jgi:hypothetical protein
LIIVVAYTGGLGQNGLFVIDKFTLFFEGHAITRDLTPNMEVRGVDRRVIPIIGEAPKNLRP